MAGELRARITEAMKNYLRQHETLPLSAVRMLLAAIKQREIDQRIVLDDAQILGVIDKLIRERRDSAVEYRKANRNDLVEREEAAITVLQQFLPEPLGAAELSSLIQAAIQEVGAQSLRDMSKVISVVRPKVLGRADMAEVSAKVKSLLNS